MIVSSRRLLDKEISISIYIYRIILYNKDILSILYHYYKKKVFTTNIVVIMNEVNAISNNMVDLCNYVFVIKIIIYICFKDLYVKFRDG